jgi:hypothetical protein
MTQAYDAPPDNPLTSQDQDSVLVRALMRKAAMARQDPIRYFEFVFREETTRARIRTLPHQRVALKFATAYPRFVIRMPIGFSKTYLMAALTSYKIGEDHTARGALISATQPQAEKPLRMVRDYIEQSPEMRMVFPTLRPSTRPGDPWTQTAITVDRPYGIRDPSVVAVGVDGSLPGSRLNWVIVDDILNLENTSTPAQREHVRSWFGTTVLGRLDVSDFGIGVVNTPWVSPDPVTGDPGDLTYVLEAAGWPTLVMSAYGGIWITNAPDFDCDEIRPGVDNHAPEDEYRLAANDCYEILTECYKNAPPPDPIFDAEEVVPLWPQKHNFESLEEKRSIFTEREFAQLIMCKARSAANDKLKEVWITQAKEAAIKLGYYGLAPKAPRDDLIVVTGVDIAIGQTQKAAQSSLFTFCVLPEIRKRLILDIEYGRWSGSELIDKVIAKHAAYGAIARVENNAAQDFLLQWLREREASCPIRAHTTGKNKADPRHGVESIFISLEQGAWLIPADPATKKAPPQIEAWLQQLRQYEPPPAHTGDILMSSWFAVEQARKQGAFARDALPAGSLANITAR